MVFSGEVVAIREFEKGDGTWHTMDPMTVEFMVQTVWKGNRYQARYIATPRSSASSGYTFMEGMEYVVYSVTVGVLVSAAGLVGCRRPPGIWPPWV